MSSDEIGHVLEPSSIFEGNFDPPLFFNWLTKGALHTHIFRSKDHSKVYIAYINPSQLPSPAAAKISTPVNIY